MGVQVWREVGCQTLWTLGAGAWVSGVQASNASTWHTHVLQVSTGTRRQSPAWLLPHPDMGLGAAARKESGSPGEQGHPGRPRIPHCNRL